MKSELRDGMQIDWDAPIAMDDGVVLRADVFRPPGGGKYPVILSYGPYAKGLAFQEGYKANWARLTKAAPEVLAGLEQQVPGVGAGRSGEVGAGRLCLRARRLARRRPLARPHRHLVARARRRTCYDCIEWAGTQPWSNGKVGINGISYYRHQPVAGRRAAATASRRALHLGGLRPTITASSRRHGGILSGFIDSWYQRQVAEACSTASATRGLSQPGHRRAGGGPPTPEARRAEARTPPTSGRAKPRAAAWSTITIASALVDVREDRSAAALRRQLGRHGPAPARQFRRLSARRLASRNGWRCTATPTSRTSTATTAMALQKRFFGHFLKGEDTGWDAQPRVSLNIRRPGEKFALRAENEWPLARTQWTKYFLQPDGRRLGTDAPAGRGRAHLRRRPATASRSRPPPVSDELEITGPVAAEALAVLRHHRRRRFSRAARVRSRRQGGHLHRLERSAHAGRARLAARLAPQARSARRPCPTGPGTRMTRNGRSRPASPSSSTSRSGRPASWCRRATASALTVRGKDYEVDGTDIARTSPNAAYPMKGVGPFTARRSATTGRRRSSAAATRCTSPPGQDALPACCRSFRRT